MNGRILQVLVVAAMLGPTEALALACVSQNTGNWNAPATWTACGGGFPGAADTVTISGGDVVTLNIANAAATSVQLGAASGTGRINFNAGSALTVSGTTTFGGGGRTGTIVMTAGGTLSTGVFVFTAGTWTPGTGTVVLTANNTLPNNTNIDTFNNLTIGSGTTAASRALTINGDFAIAAGAGWDGAGNNVDLNGDFTNNGNFTAGTGTFLFSGAALESLTGTNGGTTTFTTLTLNNGANLQLTGTHSITVTTLLTLTNGVLITNANTVYVSNGSAIASAGGNDFIQGNLKKSFPTGANVARLFEVGTGTTYSPVTVTFASITGAGDVTVSSTAGSHPQLASSGLDTATPAKLNRWWSITNSGVAFTTYTAAFTYVAADLDAAVNTNTTAASMVAVRNTGSAWTPSTLNAVPTTTAATITGETGFGDFAFGNPLGYNTTVGSGGRFNAYDNSFPATQVQGVITTKIAGTAFTLRIVHLNAGGTALATLAANVTIELLDGSPTGGTFTNNCRSTWTTVIATSGAVAFGGGNNMTQNFTVPNAYRDVRVRVTRAGGAEIGCSGDRFSIRPADLLGAGSDGSRTTAGTTNNLNNITATSPGSVHVAGTNVAPLKPFTLTVTARATGGSTTANYDGSPTAVSGFPQCCTPTTTPACGTLPAACATGTLSAANLTAVSGVASADAFYSEAGVINVGFEDQLFAGVDTADTDITQRTVPPAGASQVGRFVPDHFSISAAGATLVNRVLSACAPASTFTYLGEETRLAFTLEARNTAEAVTQNYTGVLAKLNPSSTAAYALGGRSGTANLTPQITATYQSSAPAWLNGSLAVTSSPSSNALNVIVARAAPAAVDNPSGPFTATSFGINPVDADSVAMGTLDLDVDNNASNDHKNLSVTTELRFGRLRLQNAIGSERLPLTVPIELQYWNGTGFVTNTADSCTTLQRSDLSLTFSPPSNLSACETAVSAASIAFSSGLASSALTLNAPGVGNTGSLLLTANLGAASGSYCNPGTFVAATSAGRSYLLGRWDDSANADGNANTNYDDNPSARAAFGLYGGRPNSFIFQRENF
jgi:MSHA biogenesis protein MshQ